MKARPKVPIAVQFPHILGIIGPAGSGKSTLAGLLEQHFGFVRTSFASPIKSMINALLFDQGVPKEIRDQMLYGDKKETPTTYLANRSPRHAMQTLGTEWRDLMDKHLWTTIWRNSIQDCAKVVVDDMRFLHEAETLKSLGGGIIKIDRPSFGPSPVHQSEQEFMSITPDIIINNDGVPLDMIMQLKKLRINLTSQGA